MAECNNAPGTLLQADTSISSCTAPKARNRGSRKYRKVETKPNWRFLDLAQFQLPPTPQVGQALCYAELKSRPQNPTLRHPQEVHRHPTLHKSCLFCCCAVQATQITYNALISAMDHHRWQRGNWSGQFCSAAFRNLTNLQETRILTVQRPRPRVVWGAAGRDAQAAASVR